MDITETIFHFCKSQRQRGLQAIHSVSEDRQHGAMRTGGVRYSQSSNIKRSLQLREQGFRHHPQCPVKFHVPVDTANGTGM